MNKIGIHALVWVGGWNQNESRQAIAGAAETGYDLIEVPLLNPKAVDVAATAKQLSEFGIGAAASLGLAFDTDISSADKARSEEHTSELQSRENLVCRLLLEKKKKQKKDKYHHKINKN